MSDRITIFDEQGNKLVLGPNDHLATGGEGSVYARQDRVFKLYLDPVKAQRARLEEKVERLKRLSHPGVAAPQGVLRNKNGDFLGLTLPRVNGEALCKLFTNTWRDSHQFGEAETVAVARGMRAVVDYAHAHQAVLVDSNELNWLVDGQTPVAIDVDSWQLPGYPATAIMASIRDPRSPSGFNEGTDWFAWAVVTFQLWTGIHPFKGSHPDFARGALVERMAAGVSVFDPRVKLPGAVRPVTDIPDALRAWYRDVFESGARTPPPGVWATTVAPQTAPRMRITQMVQGAVKEERLGNAGGRILGAQAGLVIAQAGAELVLWDPEKKAPCSWATTRMLQRVLRGQAVLVRTPQGPVCVDLESGAGLRLHTASAETHPLLPSRATRVWQSRNRVFAVVEGLSNGLVELRCSVMASRVVLSVDRQWPVNALSTEFFDGCFVQDCLGTPFLGVLEGDGMLQLKAPVLKRLKVVQALCVDRHSVWLTAVRKSDGETVRMRLAAGVNEFDVQEEELVSDTELNAAVLSTGVGVLRYGAGLRIAKGVQAKELSPLALGSQARLFALGSGLGVYEDSEVSRLTLG